MWFIQTPVHSSARIESITACSRRAVLSTKAVPDAYDCREASNQRVAPHSIWEYVCTARGLPFVAAKDLETDTIQVQCRKRSSVDAQVYTFSSEADVKQEIVSRGPVMTAIYVSRHFLDFWNKLLEHGSECVFDYAEHGHRLKEKKLRVVTLAIVGWDGDAWIVANEWGVPKLHQPHAWGHNGFFKLRNASASTVVSNATAMMPLTAFEASKASTGITVWVVSPPSRRPAVKVNAKVVVKHGEHTVETNKFTKWLDAENIMGTLVLSSILVCLVVIVCIHVVRVLKDAEK